jgi:hypothetical protein
MHLEGADCSTFKRCEKSVLKPKLPFRRALFDWMASTNAFSFSNYLRFLELLHFRRWSECSTLRGREGGGRELLQGKTQQCCLKSNDISHAKSFTLNSLTVKSCSINYYYKNVKGEAKIVIL